MSELLIGFAFLCGSIPFGVILARLRGVDLQKVGSGNIGATNAARALGRASGVLVLLLDAAKGYLPVRLLPPAVGAPLWVAAAMAFAAVLGHMFPPWLRLRGGKGVATGMGVFLALAPLPAAAAALCWALLFGLTRIASVSSLLAILVLPITLWACRAPREILWLAVALLPLIVWKHRANLSRLWRRQENKV